ncbi:hypothetical protein SAM23877_6858 [Streptomyces ambofaciens ATCC 23877]|uniref:Uncharacterized protein n=1 Tax=Streptomyces ambofaciens (strain ATCC 23877 / 3486 / DSM 40053 / JCM 4204 / NBRC 12836 / NRRL B-2516) TaxID=278992 RepID=A0A0K2B3U8_STRA7|nr:hypothetical protein SAM23877_6858 [Streptomyces ambofaciens ATCC 23877]
MLAAMGQMQSGHGPRVARLGVSTPPCAARVPGARPPPGPAPLTRGPGRCAVPTMVRRTGPAHPPRRGGPARAYPAPAGSRPAEIGSIPQRAHVPLENAKALTGRVHFP